MKKLFTVAMVVSLCSLWSTCYAAEKGLVGYWSLDEGKGSSVKDSSGNNNTGEVLEGKWVQGKIGGALQLDGEAAMVEIQPSKVFNVSQLTISCWIKTPEEYGNPGSWRCLVSKEGGGSVEERDYNFYLYSDDGAKVSQFHVSSAKLGATMLPLTTPYEPNTWHHVAITVDAKGKHIYYSDGKKFAEQDGAVSGAADGDYMVHIGKADNFWNGVIDEVKIYNRALSADEIAAQAKTTK